MTLCAQCRIIPSNGVKYLRLHRSGRLTDEASREPQRLSDQTSELNATTQCQTHNIVFVLRVRVALHC